MGWFAAAGCTLIASVFLFQLYLRKTNERAKPEIFVQDEAEYKKNVKHEEYPEARSNGPIISVDTSDDEHVALERVATQPAESTYRQTSPENSTGKHGLDTTADRLAMPPPPRPASAPIPNPTVPRIANMLPPSSLPPSRNRSPPRLKPPTVSISPRGPPTLNGGNGLRPPPSSASTLRVPPQKVLQNTHMQPSLSPASISTLPPSRRPSRKVILSPGHSPLDWAALQRSIAPSAPAKLRGKDATTFTNGSPVALLRVTPSMLKRQTGRKGKDAWTSYQGRVYNISAYLPFHPGGEPEMMKGAGGRSDEHFAEVHPWVNWEGMLGECCVGILVGEDEGEQQPTKSNGVGNGLDEMD